MASFTQQALRILEEERRMALVEEQKRTAAAQAEAAAKEQAERAVRVQLQAERELARIAAERTLAEEQALAQRAADARALQAELARLRARSEIDVLRDEVAQMRAEQMAVLKACHLAHLPLQEIPLHAFGELDISVKSSKAELATARGEIAELKNQVETLFSGRFRLRPQMNPNAAFCGNGETLSLHVLSDPRGATLSLWQIERI
jgi:chromosome segregation ATPase